MDGYAIKSEDTNLCEDGVSIKLEIIDFIKAGDFSNEELKNGASHENNDRSTSCLKVLML